MVGASHSIRLRVKLESQQSIVFSYPDLLKRHEKAIQQTSLVAPTLNSKQDRYFLALLERAAKYDTNPGDGDVDSGDEDNTPNRDGKADEYDYEDPFIDDSDMMLEDPYEYSQPEYDGFFVYHGSLDGPIIPAPEKKKTTTKRDKVALMAVTKSTVIQSKTASQLKAKPIPSSHSKATIKSFEASNKIPIDPIEISDTEETETDEEVEKLSIAPSRIQFQLHSTPQYDTTHSTDKPIYFTWHRADTDNRSTSVSGIREEGKNRSSFSTSLGPKANSKSTKSRPVNVLPSINAMTTPPHINASNLPPLSPAMEALMEQLRQDRQTVSFENKSKFPPCLRPIMQKIGKEMFDTYYQVNDNVVDHLVNILPYNKFTMRKYLVTRSGPAAVERFQIEVNQMIKVLAEEVQELMPEQIQQYEEKLRQHEQRLGDVDLPIERKFRCNTVVRRAIYEILTLDMLSVSLSNEIAEMNNRPGDVIAEKRARRAMYAKILPCWPESWMTTYDISRHYSGYKVKMKNNPLPFASHPIPSSTAGAIQLLPPNVVKRSASPTPLAFSSSRNVSQLGQMGYGGDKRQKLSDDTNGSPVNISSDDETDRRASDDFSRGSRPNFSHLFSTALPAHLDDRVGYSEQTSQKSPFMNIASLISKP